MTFDLDERVFGERLWIGGGQLWNTVRPPPFSPGTVRRQPLLRVRLFRAGLCHKTNAPHNNDSEMECLCETCSVEGFVQLVACNLLPHGYWFYVTGIVPEGKDVRRVDAKLIRKYGAALGKAARSRRKRLGLANVRYLRHDRFFVLLATYGRHRFHLEDARSIRDVRRVPLKFAGYSISYRRGGRRRDGGRDRGWHSHVEIDRRRFAELRAFLVEMAARWSTERLALEFYRLPFEPYAPVRRQMLLLLKAVNAQRKRAGLSPLPHTVLPMRRRVVSPFEKRSASVSSGRAEGQRRLGNRPR